MDVKFINTTSSKLSSVSIVNGQLIALSDKSGLYYDLGGVRYNVFPYTVSASVTSGGTNLVTGGGVYTYAAPKSHRSTAKTYGQGDATYFGHVKVSDSYVTSGGTAASGVAASSYALNQVYTEMKVYKDNLSSKNTLDQGSGLHFERYNNVLFIYGYITASLSPGWTKVGTVSISHKLMFDENIYFVIIDDSSPQDDHMFLEARIDATDAGIYVYSFTSVTNHVLRFNTSCPIYSEY